MKNYLTFLPRLCRHLLMLAFLTLPLLVSAQQRAIVDGRVIDASTNDPLIGVAVVEKGTSNGTITDIDGKFELTTNGGSIVLSMIGYQTQEIAVSGNQTINATMFEESIDLDAVVVVGYGVQKKVNLSGSVAAIDGEAIAAKASTDVLTALQGELPGVAVLRSSGEPGSEASGLRIRGFSSSNATSTLVLIDGIEGDMKLLNADDVESISVLKDASACAIYGARAAAGVVLITTKNGKDGKTKVTYNGSFAIN